MRRAGAVSQGRATPGNGRQKSFPLNKVVLGEAILDAQTVNRMRGQSYYRGPNWGCNMKL